MNNNPINFTDPLGLYAAGSSASFGGGGSSGASKGASNNNTSSYPVMLASAAIVCLPPAECVPLPVPGFAVDPPKSQNLGGFQGLPNLQTSTPPTPTEQLGNWLSQIPGKLADLSSNVKDYLIDRDSYELGKNLQTGGFDRPAGTAAHHIVPSGSNNPSAVAARGVLDQFGIGINSADNGVFLPNRQNSTAPGAYHPSLHTNDYYDAVAQRLQSATTRGQVIDVLNSIRDDLLKDKFPY